MRYILALPVLSFSLALAACGDDSVGPYELDPADSVQSRGTLLASDKAARSGFAWVPGTELVAFTYWTSAGACAIRKLDVESGLTTVVDRECTAMYSYQQQYWRRLVAALNGTLYYTVGIDGAGTPEWVLREAEAGGGDVTTLRSGEIDPALAVSPDGRYLAYSVREDSLILRDLSSGTETQYAYFGDEEGLGGPIVFSPDGSELLYGKWLPRQWTQRRLSLVDGTSEAVSLPDGVFHAQLFRWGASGIEALVEMSDEYHVVDLATGGSVEVGSVTYREGEPYEQLVRGYEAWSSDGSKVAYWIARCLDWAEMFDCAIVRYALYVADTRTGSRVRVAYTGDSPNGAVFSPDGTRLVYHGSPEGESAGDFYVVDVP